MNTNRSLVRPHHSKFEVIYRITDLIVIAASLVIACLLYNQSWQERYSFLAVIAIVFFMFFAGKHGLYQSWRTSSLVEELKHVWLAWIGAIFCVVVAFFFIKVSTEYSRAVVSIWAVLAGLSLCLWRALLRYSLHKLRQNGHNQRKIAIVGANQYGEGLAKTLGRAAWMGFHLVGFYDDRDQSRIDIDHSLRIVGDIDELIASVQQGAIDDIYVTLPLRAEARVGDLVERLADTTVSLYYVPNFFAFDLLHARWQTFGNYPIVSVYDSPFYGVDGWLKRAEDLVLSILVLCVVAVPMLFIAIGVKLSSPGPIIFKQTRYGSNGEKIEVWKFRSMSACDNGSDIKQAQAGDPRVTVFGRFLRRTSLDELPQFFNVLQGRMSVIGPRPHAVIHNEQYRKLIKGYMLRHKVKPGITGWAQVNGWRGETDTLDKMEKRIEYDLAYIRNWSLALDCKIFLLTLLRGFVGEKVY